MSPTRFAAPLGSFAMVRAPVPFVLSALTGTGAPDS